jgi:hypothetical protein
MWAAVQTRQRPVPYHRKRKPAGICRMVDTSQMTQPACPATPRGKEG